MEIGLFASTVKRSKTTFRRKFGAFYTEFSPQRRRSRYYSIGMIHHHGSRPKSAIHPPPEIKVRNLEIHMVLNPHHPREGCRRCKVAEAELLLPNHLLEILKALLRQPALISVNGLLVSSLFSGKRLDRPNSSLDTAVNYWDGDVDALIMYLTTNHTRTLHHDSDFDSQLSLQAPQISDYDSADPAGASGLLCNFEAPRAQELPSVQSLLSEQSSFPSALQPLDFAHQDSRVQRQSQPLQRSTMPSQTQNFLQPEELEVARLIVSTGNSVPQIFFSTTSKSLSLDGTVETRTTELGALLERGLSLLLASGLGILRQSSYSISQPGRISDNFEASEYRKMALKQMFLVFPKDGWREPLWYVHWYKNSENPG